MTVFSTFARIAIVAALVFATGCLRPTDDSPAPTSEPAMNQSEPVAGGDAAPEDGARTISKSGHDITRLSPERVQELAQGLSDEARDVLLSAGTELQCSGAYWDSKAKGVYLCALCSLPLFDSETKFESGTGWPSYFQPVDPQHIGERRDLSHGMVRTEIHCARCGGHLGHLFDDAPRTPTGLRYCINSVSLEFVPRGEALPAGALPVRPNDDR